MTFCGEQRHPATAVSSSLTLLDEDGNCREDYWENYGLALSKGNLKKKENLNILSAITLLPLSFAEHQ
ncbi:hypothetical protein [Allocoleopsis franciscana]|uniref:hypothetical protein n=1 Tax=Allocoleopsis franciscana TaxID=2886352 RepID=UPI000302D7C3|nr:hypothetical protein [Allocoleopsis franciscana]